MLCPAWCSTSPGAAAPSQAAQPLRQTFSTIAPPIFLFQFFLFYYCTIALFLLLHHQSSSSNYYSPYSTLFFVFAFGLSAKLIFF
jgi:hypothetical protein